MEKTASKGSPPRQTIWWFGSTFFTLVHIGAFIGLYYRPFSSVSWETLLLTFVLYQGAMLGVTMGYHRLYSHRAFKAGPILSAVVAFLGASATQGSARWCDQGSKTSPTPHDPVHDPYAASSGLLWSHLGWVFYKTHYERMNLIDTADLDKDTVPLSFFAAFGVPPLVSYLRGDHDVLGAFIWAGLVKCVLVWHCTFFINSLAHWNGVQLYTDENTSRGNFILAVLTCGEGNHNFHTFPQDFRSGPTILEWDPPKWILLLLQRFGLVSNLRRARQDDVSEAKLYMSLKAFVDAEALEKLYPVDAGEQPSWTLEKAQEYADSAGRCLVVIGGYIMDVTAYLGEHPGGAAIIRKYSLRKAQNKANDNETNAVDPELWKQATWAFSGGMNKHSRPARRRLRDLTIARLVED
ncbi:hypothetical protein NM688_g6962 [Phlebia brevispora]|uniref:Uncharacterized protein n=1 Tax=Phlebia brevispora TaxID=194682 RepID=A0ACC1SAG6_9APHY|nr:hypothetical protein NM688_g6962 [Phlebia brevispora]